MAGQIFYPVFICNVCFNLDWTINYLSTTTTTTTTTTTAAAATSTTSTTDR